MMMRLLYRILVLGQSIIIYYYSILGTADWYLKNLKAKKATKKKINLKEEIEEDDNSVITAVVLISSMTAVSSDYYNRMCSKDLENN